MKKNIRIRKHNLLRRLKLRAKLGMVLGVIGIAILEPLIFDPVFILNENQILYFLSTLSQTTAGLFGLVLAAYAIIDPKLKSIGHKEDGEEDATVERLRKQYFENIIVLSILCAITIFCSLFVICGFRDFNDTGVAIGLNLAAVLCVSSISLFLLFGCSLLNPKALDELGKEIVAEINREYGNSESGFEPFLIYYNRLETLIMTYAQELQDTELQPVYYYNGENGRRRLQIFQALDILGIKNIIDKNLRWKIDRLRKYRNALAHTTSSKEVNVKIFQELKEIYEKLKQVYEHREKTEEYGKFIEELHQIGRMKILDEQDEKIIKYIKENPQDTVKEISEGIGWSWSNVSRKLRELEQREIIVKTEDGYEMQIELEC